MLEVDNSSGSEGEGRRGDMTNVRSHAFVAHVTRLCIVYLTLVQRQPLHPIFHGSSKFDCWMLFARAGEFRR
jgi:hypothetical protein